jgi:hypothetical protein
VDKLARADFFHALRFLLPFLIPLIAPLLSFMQGKNVGKCIDGPISKIMNFFCQTKIRTADARYLTMKMYKLKLL